MTNLIEVSRKIYNRVVYFILVLFVNTYFGKNFRLFKESNGWCFTLGKGGWIYKIWAPFFLLHPTNSFKKFKKFHRYLQANGGCESIPFFDIHHLYIKYRFIVDSKALLESIFSLKNSQEKLSFFLKLFFAIDDLHKKNLVHNDLKPKNILVDNKGKIYFIDFENSFIAKKDQDFAVDFEKLIPRIIYTLSFAELKEITINKDLSVRCRAYLTKYLDDFKLRPILSGFSDLSFESLSGNELEDDLDVTVQSFVTVKAIISDLVGRSLDYFIFFYARNDVKLYVYNIKNVAVIDIHLHLPIGKYAFFCQKNIKNKPVQIALTGPDGSGKTTLTEWLVTNHNSVINKNLIACGWLHANRFEKFYSKKLSIFARLLNKFTASYYTKLKTYKKLLSQNTKPFLVFDRSFLDQSIGRDGKQFILFYLIRFFLPNNIENILLRASALEIVERKQEMTIEAIERYYQFMERYLRPVAVINSADLETNKYKFASVVYYLLFTNQKYR